MSQPNILFIISDDHRHDATRAYGDPIVQTPNLDKLAASGTSFRHNHIMGGLSGAVCVPTRACIQTGASVFRACGHNDLRDGKGYNTINPDLALMPETFRQAGYHTFGTGKWHNDRASFARNFADGGKIFFGGMSDHDKVPTNDFDPTGEYSRDEIYMGEDLSTEMFAGAAINFLNNHASGENGEQPFFLYCSFTAPHDPRTSPPEYADMYKADTMPLPPNFRSHHGIDNGDLYLRDEMLAEFPRTPEEIRQHIADYYGIITHMDNAIGRVLDALADNGYANNTIVVYVADHGISIGQHGLMGKQNMYAHSVRVPMIVSGPNVPAGQEVHALTYSYDLFPTLCEMAGIDVPASVESNSLVSLVKSPEGDGRAHVCTVYRDVQRMVNDGEWKLIRYYHSDVTDTGEDTIQLFHVAEDPWELNDLSKDPAHQDRLASLAATLSTWMVEAGDPWADRPVLV
ncbi:MAG: sulfatase-like hydrolase/transferase [Chloroflexota bacterium]